MSRKHKKPVPKRSAEPASKPASIPDLVRAARRGRPTLVMTKQFASLAEGELVVAIGDRHSVAVAALNLPKGARIDLARGASIAKLAAQQLGAGRFDSPRSAVLTTAEEKILEEGGFDDRTTDEATPWEEGELEFVKLLENSLSAGEAAGVLGVNPSRVRQRVLSGELLAIKDGASWRLPRFQFLKNRLVPGINRVLPALRGLSPVSVARWFSTPHPDLEVDDEHIATPLQWLIDGRDPQCVAELADNLS